MDLSDYYPTSAVLIASEIALLDYLRDNRYIKETHPQFAQDAAQCYGRSRHTSSGFEFNSYFDIWHAQMHRGADRSSMRRTRAPNVRLPISARIELDDSAFRNITYCLAVLRIRSNRPVILRKFHFDVTVPIDSSERRTQQHPQCHLQYCGTMYPHMTTLGCHEAQLNQMHPWLSEPRIFFWPMSLAILIDMALHEFPDDRSRRFRASGEWRDLVRKQENLVLRPFYEKCVEVITDKKKENRILADEFYVG